MDIFETGVLYDFDIFSMTEEQQKEVLSAADALIKCVSKFGRVDLDYMANVSGRSVSELISVLAGKAIFQNPSIFIDGNKYNEDEGWLLASQYLCGRIPEKLRVAQKVNAELKRFDRNVEVLEKRVPEKVTSSSIHVYPGATWVSNDLYTEFAADTLHVDKKCIKITFNKEMAVYKIECDAKIALKNSVLNNYTFGTPDMPAIKIIEHTLNARTVKVFDRNWIGFGKYESVVNQTKTMAAQEKQTKIIERFEDWIHEDSKRMEKLCELYNDRFVGYTFTPFDGSFLSFEDLNPEISLFPHQKNAIARILLSDTNLLLAHDVGTGKTYVMCCGVHELYRTGISKKNLIVVPNNVLHGAVGDHKKLYPQDKILAVYPKDFTPAKRNKVLEEIRDGDYAAVYMAFSSFDMIKMSKKYWVNKKQGRINELKRAAAYTSDKFEKSMLEAEAESLEKKLKKYIADTKDCAWLNFDDLGIETLVVDEAHNYKNIPINTRTENITGLNTGGSKKCMEMYEKSQNVKKLIMATGTPLTNSLTDLFVFQQYLQPAEMEFRGINTLDTWINSFAEREVNYEVDVDARHLRLVNRFSRYHNLPELMGMFSTVCDFYVDSRKEGLPRFDGYKEVLVPRNEMQQLYIDELSARADAVRSRLVDRKEDNLLKITTHGRLCAIDIRLVDPELFEGVLRAKTKVNYCADKIMEQYSRNPDTCQLVFSDIGTPKSTFNIYDELKAVLISKGMPESKIAFIHDAVTKRAKEKLFDKMNSGEISVCIGSTQKLGTGVNVQSKLVAVHEIDVPWKPSDEIQREGRIIRQGNTCDEVYIYHYITEGTFDSFSWQVLEKKARFLQSFMSGIVVDREADEIDDFVLRYSEIKALAIGNTLIKSRVETANRLSRAKIAYRNRQKDLLDLREIVSMVPVKIAGLDKEIDITDKDAALYAANKEKIPNDERSAFGEELIEALNGNIRHNGERLFSSYQGFSVYLPSMMTENERFVNVRSENGGEYRIEIDCEKVMGCSRRIDYALDHLPDKLQTLKERRQNELRRLNDANANLAKDNPFKDDIDRLTAELEDIDNRIKEAEEAEKQEKLKRKEARINA